jgi:Zn finger protein HypA/HybF involved in hydrogenase expression
MTLIWKQLDEDSWRGQIRFNPKVIESNPPITYCESCDAPFTKRGPSNLCRMCQIIEEELMRDENEKDPIYKQLSIDDYWRYE